MPTISLWAMMSSNRAGRYFSIHGSDARTRPLGFSTSPSMILGDNKASNHNPLEKPVPRVWLAFALQAQARLCHSSTQGTKWRGSLFEHVWPVTHLGLRKKFDVDLLDSGTTATEFIPIPLFGYKFSNTCCGHMSQTKFIPLRKTEFN